MKHASGYYLNTYQARIEDTNLNCVRASVQVIAQLL